MANNKRGRGRPKGTSRHKVQDEISLGRMADLIHADPRLQLTTAMRRLGLHDEIEHRRLRRKWGASRGSYLAAVQQRQQAHASAVLLANLERVAERAGSVYLGSLQAISTRIDPSMVRLTVEQLQHIQNAVEGVAERVTRFVAENPDSTFARMVREPGFNPFDVRPLGVR